MYLCSYDNVVFLVILCTAAALVAKASLEPCQVPSSGKSTPASYGMLAKCWFLMSILFHYLLNMIPCIHLQCLTTQIFSLITHLLTLAKHQSTIISCFLPASFGSYWCSPQWLYALLQYQFFEICSIKASSSTSTLCYISSVLFLSWLYSNISSSATSANPIIEFHTQNVDAFWQKQ